MITVHTYCSVVDGRRPLDGKARFLFLIIDDIVGDLDWALKTTAAANAVCVDSGGDLPLGLHVANRHPFSVGHTPAGFALRLCALCRFLGLQIGNLGIFLYG